jgi:hypothetical protein
MYYYKVTQQPDITDHTSAARTVPNTTVPRRRSTHAANATRTHGWSVDSGEHNVSCSLHSSRHAPAHQADIVQGNS